MCSFCSIKCWFIFFNGIFLASGVALIMIGALQCSTYSQISTFAGSSLFKIAVVLIAVGATITLVTLLGHCGAFLNNSSMVSCILTGASFYIFRSRMNSGINTQARAAVYTAQRTDTGKVQLLRRRLLHRLVQKWGLGNHEAVPDSCCPEKREGCGHGKNKAHKKGCISAIKLFLLKNLVWVDGVCIALGITEVFGVVVGARLCLDFKRKNYENVV